MKFSFYKTTFNYERELVKAFDLLFSRVCCVGNFLERELMEDAMEGLRDLEPDVTTSGFSSGSKFLANFIKLGNVKKKKLLKKKLL